MPYDPRQHRRRSIRLKGYDYSQEGAYFVTICTHKFRLLFDKEENRNIAERCLLDIPSHFPFVELDEWIVMPNHIHGIITIAYDGRGTACRAPTSERFRKPIPSSIPTIVRSYKSAVTKRINAARGTPGARGWQRNYYEHVIRDEEELNLVRQYVMGNPLQWDTDENNPDRHDLTAAYGMSHPDHKP